MRFGFVLFAQAAFGVGAGSVEVAQADARQVMDVVEPAQQRLHHHLRFAIRIDGMNGEVLQNGVACGVPYTAAVEEKTRCFTPARTMAVSSESEPPTLLVK